jgi:rod shape-determining protein MreC
VSIEPSAGNLTKTVEVQPFVGFTKLDIVGVVVVGPRTDPRDSVLPTRPAPSPKATAKKSPTPGRNPNPTGTGTALPPGNKPNPNYTSGG